MTDRQTSAPFHDMATRSGPHNKRLRSRYYTLEAVTTDGHKASRGLSATVELLVYFAFKNCILYLNTFTNSILF